MLLRTELSDYVKTCLSVKVNLFGRKTDYLYVSDQEAVNGGAKC
jgi:hypothetical protein